jgi:uncharacterized protein YcbX
VITTSSLRFLGERGQVDTATARFRPNVVLELFDAAAETPEASWVGKKLRIGDVAIAIETKTLRCSIPSRAQPTLGVAAEAKMTRAMVDVVNRHMGVYASIITAGSIAIDDPVFIE